MTEDEYKEGLKKFEDELKKFEEELEKRKWNHIKEFALSNNTHKIGDIVTDNIGPIKIEKILVDRGFMGDYPCCVYRGIELKKDLSPAKKAKVRDVYQRNVK